jgi:hypothetical protein
VSSYPNDVNDFTDMNSEEEQLLAKRFTAPEINEIKSLPGWQPANSSIDNWLVVVDSDGNKC